MLRKMPCPCCDSTLIATNDKYNLFDIFNKWGSHGVGFSSQTFEDYPDNLVITLYTCKSCGYGVFLPMVTGSANFYTDITREEYYLDDRWDFQVALDVLATKKAKTVLDVGCGQGAFLKEVAKRSSSVVCYGNDSNPSVVNKLPKSISLFADLDDVPPNLDFVTLFQVIEHVSNPVDLLKKSISKLKPGGILIVSVPDQTGPIRLFADSHTAIPPHHVSLWTPSSLDALMKKMGLVVLDKKSEPLADYLMASYMPKIISEKLGVLGNRLMEKIIRLLLAKPIVWICQKFSIKYLPIKGHTFLVVAQKNFESFGS